MLWPILIAALAGYRIAAADGAWQICLVGGGVLGLRFMIEKPRRPRPGARPCPDI